MVLLPETQGPRLTFALCALRDFGLWVARLEVPSVDATFAVTQSRISEHVALVRPWHARFLNATTWTEAETCEHPDARVLDTSVVVYREEAAGAVASHVREPRATPTRCAEGLRIGVLRCL